MITLQPLTPAQMSGAELLYADKVAENLYSPKPDCSYLESLAQTIDKALQARDGDKLTLEQLVRLTADRIAVEAGEAGTLPCR